VLPLEIPPFKSYTLGVIETACSAYSDAQLPNVSLASVVRRMGRGHPHRSTLHGWLAGLGERASGRLDRVVGYLPVSALIAQSSKELGIELAEQWAQRPGVALSKYQSDKRREQLEGCARLFGSAQRLFSNASHPFCTWEGWLQGRFNVAAWRFPARLGCTDFQHLRRRGSALQCVSRSTEAQQQTKEHNHAARSPP
jgi:hypothetical protein